MTRFDVFRLHPRGAFHFGTPGVGIEATIERCPSDTLYGALWLEARRAGLPVPARGADDSGAPAAFRLSSCFPFAGATLLFPLPRLRPARRAELQPGQRKRLKHVRYVSPTILQRLLAGDALPDFLPDERGNGAGRLLQGGEVLVAREDDPGLDPATAREPDRLWQQERVDHVTVDRAGSASAYYAVGQTYFRAACGLYVLAQCADAAARDLLLDLLTRLGHSGLGGRRNQGLGQFDVEPADAIELPEAAGRTRALLLSRYLPTQAELESGVLGAGAAYDLAPVGGWLYSHDSPPRLRKTIHVLAEGSVVRCPDGQPPRGRAVDLRPDDEAVSHPVWRYGYALPVGVTFEEAA